jgi:hypothetical protein
MTAFVDNTNLLRIKGLFNVVDDLYVNAGAVTATIKDSNGDVVAGQSWPVTLDYVAASNGIYRVALNAAIIFIAGATYTAEITALDGASTGFWEFPFIPVTRTRK